MTGRFCAVYYRTKIIPVGCGHLLCGVKLSLSLFHLVKQTIIQKLGIEVGYTPFVSTREHLVKYVPQSVSALPPRSMQDSFTSAIIPLTTDKILKDKYVGFMGNVRVGRLMEDMDMFAGKLMRY